MKLELKEPKNPNYAAIVVRLDKFVTLDNCDNVKAALIFGNSVIVSKTAAKGEVGLFFPVETALSSEFLGANNLYRKPEWGNVDPNQKGFFENHGRVKAVKFRGHKSEGFWIPLHSLNYLSIPGAVYQEGMVFDTIGDHEICKKYVPKCNPARQNLKGKQARLEDSIVAGQFRLHYDTENFRRNYDRIQPNDWISITDKWHGTSVVIANLLVNRKQPWYEKLLSKLGVNIRESEYGIIYSSRRVVKDVAGQTKTNLHFYDEDIWGIVSKEVQDSIPKGFTLYGEIVGYTPQGEAIQKGYTYGCEPGKHRFLVYRVTSTNFDGHVTELSWPQLVEFCKKYRLETVKELWYGLAEEFNPNLPIYDIRTWQENFLAQLEANYVKDQMCEYNDFKVPAEGIVIRIDKLDQCDAYKLKNFKFLEHESKELDKGEADIETIEGTNE